jgi:hypothetical protein
MENNKKLYGAVPRTLVINPAAFMIYHPHVPAGVNNKPC